MGLGAGEESSHPCDPTEAAIPSSESERDTRAADGPGEATRASAREQGTGDIDRRSDRASAATNGRRQISAKPAQPCHSHLYLPFWPSCAFVLGLRGLSILPPVTPGGRSAHPNLPAWALLPISSLQGNPHRQTTSPIEAASAFVATRSLCFFR